MSERSPSAAKERAFRVTLYEGGFFTVDAADELEARIAALHTVAESLDFFVVRPVAADRLPDPARCRNPRCNKGWVERGDNESGGAPAFRCRTEGCPYAPASAAVSPAEPPEAAPRIEGTAIYRLEWESVSAAEDMARSAAKVAS